MAAAHSSGSEALLIFCHRFLWVDLQIKHLCGLSNAHDVRKNLGRLPKDLEDTYRIIWSDIDSEGGKGPEIAKTALMCVMVSSRPLRPDEVTGLCSKASLDD